MKSPILKSCLCFLLMVLFVASADAQRRRTTRGTTTPATGQPDATQQEQNNNTSAPSGYNPYGNLPIEVDNSAGGYNDSVLKKSMRPDAAFDKSFINERTPLPYEHLRWDDALFAEKVWREIDLREKMNMPFR